MREGRDRGKERGRVVRYVGVEGSPGHDRAVLLVFNEANTGILNQLLLYLVVLLPSPLFRMP